MNKLLTMIQVIILGVLLTMMLTACGGGGAEEGADGPESAEQGVELMGISRYSRTELGMHMEFEVSNHQVDENGRITMFDIHRTKLEQVTDGGMLVEDVDAEDSTITLEYDESGIISARTDTPGYGFMMHELTYKDGLIDTDAYSTDWGTADKPYKHQYTYEEADGIVTKSDGERIEGKKAVYPCEYEYNDNGDVTKISMNQGTDYWADVDIEYDEKGNVTKISNSNKDGVFLVREFEYTSLGNVGKADASKTGFRKWQEFSIVEKALMNCY